MNGNDMYSLKSISGNLLEYIQMNGNGMYSLKSISGNHLEYIR
jgi:hypothetical protein